jgi:uncharacterized protein DUF6188
MHVKQIDGGREFLFEHGTVEMIRIDHRLALVILDPPDHVDLIIESTLKLQMGDAPIMAYPEQTDSLIPVLKLLHSRASAVRTETSGRLIALFENDVALVIEPDAAHEAWAFSCHGKFQLICRPGGSITVFADEPIGAGFTTNQHPKACDF